MKETLADLIDAFQQLGAGNFPYTKKAVIQAAHFVEDYWVQAAMGQITFPGFRTVNEPEYARSIRVFPATEFRAIVAATDREGMKRLDDGVPERRMVEEVRQGKWKNTRQSKDGSSYAVVPLRVRVQAMKAMMRETPSGPKDVYSLAKRLAKSYHVEGRPGQRENVWSGSLSGGFKELKNRWYHKSDIIKGLVRFETSTGKGKSSEYMTFRTISTKQDSSLHWVIPAKPAVPIVDLVRKATEDNVRSIVTNGIIADFATLGMS